MVYEIDLYVELDTDDTVDDRNLNELINIINKFVCASNKVRYLIKAKE